MKILKADQIRSWDQYTIAHEPIASIDLMERAATKCFEWLDGNGWLVDSFAVFCGKGNNGGDGLAIARLLAIGGCKVSVHILEFGHRGTEDFQTNLAKLHLYPSVDIHFIQDKNNFHPLTKDTVVIDALFGSGLTRPPDGITSNLIDHINNSGCTIIAIDVPSGMSVDQSSTGNKIVKANYTLSFQCYKLAFLMAENAAFIGEVIILDIGLLPEFLSSLDSNLELIDKSIIRSIYKPRNRFAHKGNFGHVMIIAGSYGKTGAAVLSAKACLRSGVGLLTCFIPKCGYEVLQISVSEAMVMTDANSSIITKIDDDILKYDSIGIGPGIGTASETRAAIRELVSIYKRPIVLDADALNGLSMEKKLPALPPGSILTPHPKEFERLLGESKNDFERIEKALQNAKLINCVIVLKGHHTFIATASGKGCFNNTGNAGMATAGSGDVLTGMITGLLAQGYSSEDASILGVHLHGLAGDIATKEFSKEAMIAGDIIDSIGKAFKQLE
ncbi:MAG TPA: NAD(P)H-hydrate dehydratase [Chitinophagaceae bacterium]|jgi:NAD(P)H-hydrate epimerase|nr:NAD(P)H-hydrate dehydratase [Chitinophagaceae bacterium]